MTYAQLHSEERYSIALLRARRCSVSEIARELGRHRSTIYREVKRNAAKFDGAYRPFFASEKANGRRRRSRRNRRYTPAHFAVIERLLREDYSPQQIVGRLRLEGVQVMSHETIYLHIWADRAHGGTLWRHLRHLTKVNRKRYARHDSRGRLSGKRMITERPAIVERRERLGDWEIDTVHRLGNRHAAAGSGIEQRDRRAFAHRHRFARRRFETGRGHGDVGNRRLPGADHLVAHGETTDGAIRWSAPGRRRLPTIWSRTVRPPTVRSPM
eukprot:gene29150-38608_t